MHKSSGFGKRVKPEALPKYPVNSYNPYLERRIENNRASQLKKVSMTFNNGFSACDGVLRNLTSVGARIETDHPIDLPDVFTLSDALGNLQRNCRKVWRKGNIIGVEFVR